MASSTSPACNVLWIFCLAFIQLLPEAFALADKKTIKVVYSSKVDSFVFDRDGTFDFFAEGTSMDSLYMVLVDNLKIQSQVYSDKNVCELAPPYNGIYQNQDSAFKYILPLNAPRHIEISDRGAYSFFIANCRDKVTTAILSIEYTAKNGNSHLPYNAGNVIWVYLAVSSTWILLGLLFVYFPIVLFLYQMGCGLMRLQVVVLAFVSVKIIASILMLYYWYAYARYGSNHKLFCQVLCDVSILVEMVALYIILFLSVTWNPSVFRMPLVEKRKLLFFFFISIIIALFFCRPNDNLIALCLLLVCFFLAFITINSLRFRIQQLEFYLLIVERLRIFGISEETFHGKICAYRCVCAATILYFLTRLLIFFVKFAWTWWYIEWVTILVNECAVLIMCAVVLYFLVVPMNSPIFSTQAEVDTISRLESWIEQNVQREIENEQQQLMQEEPWDMSSTIVVEWPSSVTFQSKEGDLRNTFSYTRPLSVCIKEDCDKLSGK